MWLYCSLPGWYLLSWQFLRQLLDIVERWGAHGRLHRDLSSNNVGFGPHGEVLVFDLATIMTTMPVPIDPGVYMALLSGRN